MSSPGHRAGLVARHVEPRIAGRLPDVRAEMESVRLAEHGDDRELAHALDCGHLVHPAVELRVGSAQGEYDRLELLHGLLLRLHYAPVGLHHVRERMAGGCQRVDSVGHAHVLLLRVRERTAGAAHIGQRRRHRSPCGVRHLQSVAGYHAGVHAVGLRLDVQASRVVLYLVRQLHRHRTSAGVQFVGQTLVIHTRGLHEVQTPRAPALGLAPAHQGGKTFGTVGKAAGPQNAGLHALPLLHQTYRKTVLGYVYSHTNVHFFHDFLKVSAPSHTLVKTYGIRHVVVSWVLIHALGPREPGALSSNGMHDKCFQEVSCSPGPFTFGLTRKFNRYSFMVQIYERFNFLYPHIKEGFSSTYVGSGPGECSRIRLIAWVREKFAWVREKSKMFHNCSKVLLESNRACS